MMRSLRCPHCNALIEVEDPFPEGARFGCSNCGGAFRLYRSTDGGIEPVPALADSPAAGGRGARGSLPPRASSSASAPAASAATALKRGRPSGIIPRAQQSRKTFATLILGGIVGLGLLFVGWYVRTVRSLDKTADQGAKHLVDVMENRAHNKPTQRPGTLAKPAQTIATKSKQQAPAAASLMAVRPIAPATMQVGDLVVGVSVAEVTPVRIHKQDSSVEYLALSLRVTNLAQQAVSYRGLQYSDASFVLRDIDRNYYNRVKFFPGEFPDDCVEERNIEPGSTITDLVVFEPPNAPYKSLELDLPVSSDSTFRFTIPNSMIRRAVPVAGNPPPVAMAPAAAGTPKQADPKAVPAKPAGLDDLKRRSLILSEYRELWTQTERRAKSMSYDRGRQYKRTRRTEILDSLSEKYKISRDDLRLILP